MSDGELNESDAELLALGGVDSDVESAKEESRPPTPKKSRAKGVTQRKTTKGARRGKAARDASDDEGEASSQGSAAMSESENEPAPTSSAQAVEDDGPLYPLEGKFTSEKDRADILAMPELQRETVLAERAAEQERRRQNNTLKQLREARLRNSSAAALKKRKVTDAELDETPRKTTKPKTKATETLEAYKKKREQVKDQRQRNADRKAGDPDSPQRDEEESDRDAEGEEDVEWDEPKTRTAAKNEPEAEMRDYERIRVGRTNFARVCFYPGFEDAIKGCFTRVCIGPDKQTNQNLYRMCQIKSFTTGRAYTLDGPNNRPVLTDQYAVVAQGKAEKEWPFSACSDSKFTDREYDRYKSQLQQDNVRPPLLSFLQAKCTGIHDLLNRQWTDGDINARLARAKAVQSSQSELDRLQKERAIAAAELDESTIAKIDAQLQAIEARLPAQKPQAPKVMSQQEKLAARNAANRKKNSEEIRAAQIADRKRERENAEAVARGGKSTDRHGRVRTVAKTYFDAGESKSKEESEMDDLFGDGADTSARASPAPKEVVKPKKEIPQVKSGLGVGGMKKKKQDEDFMEAMDLGIEIDI